MNKKFVIKLLSGTSDHNIRFDDLRKFLLTLNFFERIKGSHHIFTREDIEEIINLQQLSDGTSKSYQIKQVRKVFLKYKLMEEVRDV